MRYSIYDVIDVRNSIWYKKNIRWTEFPKSKHYSNSAYEGVIAQQRYAACEYLAIARISHIESRSNEKK